MPRARSLRHRLCDAAGKPLDSADLIRRVQQFRQDIGFQAIKMQQRLLNDQGFDHAWQDTLHRFYQEAAPRVRPQRGDAGENACHRAAPRLHYFPFAALVTRPDTQKHGAEEMVNPQFLADEPIALCYAPSLADWDLLRQRSNRPLPRAFALAVPNLPAPALPGVREDVRNLEAAFGARIGSIRLNGAATETEAWSFLAERECVLFATHGSNAADRPLESCLYLYPDKSNDGRLIAAELYGKSTRTT